MSGRADGDGGDDQLHISRDRSTRRGSSSRKRSGSGSAPRKHHSRDHRREQKAFDPRSQSVNRKPKGLRAASNAGTNRQHPDNGAGQRTRLEMSVFEWMLCGLDWGWRSDAVWHYVRFIIWFDHLLRFPFLILAYCIRIESWESPRESSELLWHL